MNTIKFECQHCRQSLEADLDMAGDKVECPSCHKSVTVPESGYMKCRYCAEPIRKDATKCRHCGEFVSGHQEPTAKQEARTLTPNVARGEVLCPTCRYVGVPDRKSKGSILVGLFLCLFWLLPGIIYFICMNGYRYSCPRCGIKILKE
jgi:DNA-directed RNA polymerase subunit RPC12/RpoP